MRIAPPPWASRNVVFEARVAASDRDDSVECSIGKRCAAQVRMENDAGRIDHGLKRRPRPALELGRSYGFDTGENGAIGLERHVAACERFTHNGRAGSQCLDNGGCSESLFERADRRLLSKLVD